SLWSKSFAARECRCSLRKGQLVIEENTTSRNALQAGIMRRHFGQRGPIRTTAPVGDGVQVMVPEQTVVLTAVAGQGHRHGAVVCCFERKTHVFQAELQFETGRLETLLRDDLAIIRIDGRVEEPVQNLEKLLRVYAGFAHQREGFTH